MLVASPTFDNDLHDDSQFVACLQETQRCVERLQALAAFVCNLHPAQGAVCADRHAIDTEIERAVHAAAHDRLMQQLRIRHARDDALTAEAASYFLSMDPDDMGVAPQHVAAVSCCLLDAPQAPQHQQAAQQHRRALNAISRQQQPHTTRG